MFNRIGLFLGIVSVVSCQPLFLESVFKANTSGLQVVKATVDLISRTCILDNAVFLRRVANVETDNGDDIQTYRDGYHGGIWNVDEEMFQLTKDNDNLQQEYYAIKDKLNIDWSNVTWLHLRQPIYSALAVTLLLKVNHFQNVPENVEIQATIWKSLNPGRNQPFTYLSREYMDDVDCDSQKMIDLVLVLNFYNFNTQVLPELIQYMKTFIGRFDLGLTRIGIVTKKNGQPSAAWYLNSQIADYTVLEAIVALKYEAENPIPVANSLKWTHAEMYNASKGGRLGASKILLLITDNVTEPESAKVEATRLEHKGIQLLVLKLSNRTHNHDVDRLVPEPACQNTKSAPTFATFANFDERMTRRICAVAVLLDEGVYTFPCSYNLSARLPETSLAYHILVEPSEGNMTFFAARTYHDPDESSHEARLVSMANNGSVLYVRGSDPMYITVRGQHSSCLGTYKVQIQTKLAFARKDGVCFVAGTVRRCNDLTMELMTNDVILVRDPNGPYLCDPNNQTIEKYPHQTNPKKFYLCDRDDNTFLGLCPVLLPGCNQFTSGCMYTNPCTETNLLSGHFEHIDPCADATNHVTCTYLGTAEVMQCPANRIWNEDTKHCISEYVHDPRTNTYYKNITNPCIHSHEDHAYFPFPTSQTMYIFCDKFGDAFASTCRDGVWNEQMKMCTQKSANLFG